MSSPSDRAEELRSTILHYYDFVTGRIRSSFAGTFSLTQWEWLRLALIVVGYLVVRPFLVKFGEYIGEKEMTSRERKENERKDRERRERRAKGKARLGANDLRGGGGGRVIGEVVDDEDGDGEVLVGVGGSAKDAAAAAGTARNRGGARGKKAADIQKLLDEMSSDEDVEDLITGVSKDR